MDFMDLENMDRAELQDALARVRALIEALDEEV